MQLEKIRSFADDGGCIVNGRQLGHRLRYLPDPRDLLATTP